MLGGQSKGSAVSWDRHETRVEAEVTQLPASAFPLVFSSFSVIKMFLSISPSCMYNLFLFQRKRWPFSFLILNPPFYP